MDRFLMEPQTKWMIGGTPILGNLHMYSPHIKKRPFIGLDPPTASSPRVVSQAPFWAGIAHRILGTVNLASELGKC